MKNLLSITLILGFVFIDFLFFHDILKPGEVTTLPQFLTGLLSIPVMILSLQSLLQKSKHAKG